MELARDLLMLTNGDYIMESRPLPAPRRHRGSKFRPVASLALQAAKADLYKVFLESGLKKRNLCATSGYTRHTLGRLPKSTQQRSDEVTHAENGTGNWNWMRCQPPCRRRGFAGVKGQAISSTPQACGLVFIIRGESAQRRAGLPCWRGPFELAAEIVEVIRAHA